MDALEVREKLEQLRREHRELDTLIHEKAAPVQPNELELQRLKKRKLHLKDQISSLEASLVPDIPA
jgi:hypothetical protein